MNLVRKLHLADLARDIELSSADVTKLIKYGGIAQLARAYGSYP